MGRYATGSPGSYVRRASCHRQQRGWQSRHRSGRQTGLLFDLESPSNAVKHIERLIAQEEEREKLGHNAQVRVAEKFSIERMTQQTIELYTTSLLG